MLMECSCAILGFSVSWFYKWIDGEPTDRDRRRAGLDAQVSELFDASGGTNGSPQIHGDPRAPATRKSQPRDTQGLVRL